MSTIKSWTTSTLWTHGKILILLYARYLWRTNWMIIKKYTNLQVLWSLLARKKVSVHVHGYRTRNSHVLYLVCIILRVHVSSTFTPINVYRLVVIDVKSCDIRNHEWSTFVFDMGEIAGKLDEPDPISKMIVWSHFVPKVSLMGHLKINKLAPAPSKCYFMYIYLCVSDARLVGVKTWISRCECSEHKCAVGWS